MAYRVHAAGRTLAEPVHYDGRAETEALKRATRHGLRGNSRLLRNVSADAGQRYQRSPGSRDLLMQVDDAYSSLQLILDLVEAGLDAGLVLLAARRAGGAGRADRLFADLDRQRAAPAMMLVSTARPAAGCPSGAFPSRPTAMRNVRAVYALRKLFSIVCGPVPSPRS